MEKKSQKEYFYILLVASLALLGTGCGSDKKSKSRAGQEVEKKLDQPTSLDGDKNSGGESSKKESDPTQTSQNDKKPSDQAKSTETAPSQVSPGHPLLGTYLQVENRQARIVIGDGLIMSTNLEFPSPSGNGTRLTPAFPHGLKYQAPSDDYRTIGTYNDGTSVFRNIEIRVRLYNSNKYLDVTLIPFNQQTGGSSSTTSSRELTATNTNSSSSTTSANESTGTVSVYCFHDSSYGGVPPCSPLPPPPLPPLPMPCPDPCSEDRSQLRYVYRFERV